MLVDLRGRLKNINLPYYKALHPLFEAVVNSIHAVEEANVPNGRIDIYVERESIQGELLDSNTYSPVTSFRVTDNGIGFNQSHFQSFQTSDTTYKEAKGSKGIGRLLWLKAFKKVEIKSTFAESTGIFFTRFFEFTPNKGVNHLSLEEIEASSSQTEIKLIDLLDGYKRKCNQKASTIAKKIIEHCMLSFLSENCPTIHLFDAGTGELINLNEYFENNIKRNLITDSIFIKDSHFSLTNLRVDFGDDPDHRINFCANGREVRSCKLKGRIADLHKRIEDVDGSAFTYIGYVTGEYLDENVNQERTQFTFPENDELEFSDLITFEELEAEVVSKVESYLNPFLQTIKEDKIERITNFINREAPEYRHLLKHNEEFIQEIPPDIADEKLELELHKVSFKVEHQLKEQSRKYLEKVEDWEKYPNYIQQYSKFLEMYNDYGKSKLAQYIVHRKTILSLLSNSLSKSESGRYSLERDVHEIIFPLRATSFDVEFERQNLWIIDERLAFHDYLASDLPFNQMRGIEIDSEDRGDLIIFNKPIAFVEGGSPYSSIVIIEFKRPMRNNYNDDDNPLSQIYRYIRKIRDNKVTDKNGRLISLVDEERTPFYAYLICDPTSKVKDLLYEQDFNDTPDRRGFYKFHEKYKAYIEIISYEKLIDDARKRNRVLFEKLNLPGNT